MPVTVTPILSEINNADAITDWSGNSGGLDDFVYVEGGATPASYTWQVAKNGTDTAQYAGAYPANITTLYTNPHLYFWFRCDVSQFSLTRASNGMTVRVTDSGGNFIQWRFAGNDTWRGEWRCIPIDLSNTTDIVASSGTLNLDAITQVQWSVTTQNINFRAIDNCWNDVFFIGEGLEATGSATTTGNFLREVANVDGTLANQFGQLQLSDGVLLAQGKIIVGDGTTQVVYTSEAEILFFKDPTTGGLDGGAIGSISTTLYTFQALGNSLNSTFSHTNGVISAAGSQNFFLDLDDTGFNSMTFTGNLVSKASEVRFWANAANTDISANTFLSCGPIYPQGCTFADNTISGATDATFGSLVISDAATAQNISGVTVVDYNGTYGVYIPATVTGTVSLDIDFDNSGTDIFWAATSGTLTVLNNTATTFAVAGGTATVDIQAAQTTVTVTPLVAGSEVRVYSRDGGGNNDVELAGVENSGTSFPFTLAAGTVVNVVIFNTLYEPVDIYNYTVPAANANLPVTQRFDRNYKT